MATTPERLPPELVFEYIKSPFFRVIAVDGVFGGLHPAGRGINMAIFSERRPLPRVTVHSVKPNGDLGEEIRDRRESRQGVLRELEADLHFDLGAAMALHKWLGEKIDELKKHLTDQGVKVIVKSEVGGA